MCGVVMCAMGAGHHLCMGWQDISDYFGYTEDIGGGAQESPFSQACLSFHESFYFVVITLSTVGCRTLACHSLLHDRPGPRHGMQPHSRKHAPIAANMLP